MFAHIKFYRATKWIFCIGVGMILSYLLSYYPWTCLWDATDVVGPAETIHWHARIHRFGEVFYRPLRTVAEHSTMVDHLVYDLLTHKTPQLKDHTPNTTLEPTPIAPSAVAKKLWRDK